MSNTNNNTITNNAQKRSEQVTHNLRIYDGHRKVPDEAKTPITAGDLKGMTDINPMWRIKSLTEDFGPVGEGWYFEKIKEETIPLVDGRIIYTIDIHLFYKMENGEWSKPVFGTGGGTFVTFRYEKLYIDDDAKKKALTDAISVCCKELGYGAEVYWDKDITKYGELGNFAPVKLPTSNVKNFANIMGEENNNPPVEVAENAVADAIKTAQSHIPVVPANTKQDNGYIEIDPTTTPVPTVQEAEEYTLEGNSKYTGWKLGAIFRIAASGDQSAVGWLNWLATNPQKSENMAWAKFYAEFLRNYYTQAANEAAKGQVTANN